LFFIGELLEDCNGKNAAMDSSFQVIPNPSFSDTQ